MNLPDCAACVGGCEDCHGTGKWQPGGTCPCGCAVAALKLTKRGHAKGCKCRPCLGARNRKKGQRAQANMHKALGGTGWTPTNEEWGAGYDIEIHVQPEAKKGAQIPASFGKFIGTDWFRRALHQSEAATAPGAHAAVYIEHEGSRSGWLVVKVTKDS